MTDVTNEQARTVRDMIEPAIMKAGGWVNTHAHADRAFTLSPEILEMRRTCTLQQKWDALDRLKLNPRKKISTGVSAFSLN